MGNSEAVSTGPQLRVLRPEELVAGDGSGGGGKAGSGASGDAVDNGTGSARSGVLQASEALLQELAEASSGLEQATPQEILQWAVDRYAPKFTMATAFGPEGMTIIHMLAQIAPETPVFNLDTGYQFAETLELREEVKRRYGIEVELKKPELSVEQYELANGGPVYSRDPNRCCFDRKIKVLQQAAVGFNAWASAIRRDQSPDRATAPIVGWDKKFGLVKISPLANWTKKDVWGLIAAEEIPYNPLHDQGYTSVGCWPCTRSTLPGEDERAGRWSGFAKTECGLHTAD
ncbi:MAG: phosphoadenylyl-sulfate reductase [Planctomycetales bacterium]|nr:phosphoadenylyl-sulfate reductase [Planctomycetales bacterium]